MPPNSALYPCAAICKLLQLACDDIDIDIALDDISGEDFAHIVEGHLEKSSEHSSVAVIRMNPDKSKHLETARIKVDKETSILERVLSRSGVTPQLSASCSGVNYSS